MPRWEDTDQIFEAYFNRDPDVRKAMRCDAEVNGFYHRQEREAESARRRAASDRRRIENDRRRMENDRRRAERETRYRARRYTSAASGALRRGGGIVGSLFDSYELILRMILALVLIIGLFDNYAILKGETAVGKAIEYGNGFNYSVPFEDSDGNAASIGSVYLSGDSISYNASGEIELADNRVHGVYFSVTDLIERIEEFMDEGDNVFEIGLRVLVRFANGVYDGVTSMINDAVSDAFWSDFAQSLITFLRPIIKVVT